MTAKQATVAASAVGAAIVAGGALAAGHVDAFVLDANQAVTHGGITCTAYNSNDAANANLVCVRNNLRGFGVIISATNVVIARRDHAKLKVVFARPNK